VKRAHKDPNQSRRRAPDKRDPRVQTLLFYAQSRQVRNNHRKTERWIQSAHKEDFTYDLAVKYGYRCLHCGSTRRLGLDHIRPVSKGGKTEFENLQLLCRFCNETKGDQIIDYRPKSEKEKG
jgi:5-methylcytosine-specific restriction endonuclease McrA